MKKILTILLFIPLIGLGQMKNSAVNVGFNVVLPIDDGMTGYSPGFSAEYIFPSIRLSYYTLSYVPSISYSFINLRTSTETLLDYNSIDNYININQNLTYSINPAIEVSSGISFDVHMMSFSNEKLNPYN